MSKYAYLLGQTDLFRHLLDKDILQELEDNKLEAHEDSKITGDRRHRKTEAEEDVELIRNDSLEQDRIVFTESPSFVTGGIMRDYQVQGLNWMISLYENGVSGILADEMGLGKTLQTISFLGYLRFFRDISGPHLVVVPKSTLQNWCNEFAMWIPEINVVLFHGDKEKRSQLIKETLSPLKFDVCVTSYEMCLMETNALRKISWKYLIIDEAHRIKNENSSLSIIVRKLSSINRLLITGTPLQNNLHELWALLNFLIPDVFGSADAFHSWFSDNQEKVEQLHRVLRPFMLRRIKSDVEKNLLPKKKVNLYVGMSNMQRKWYQKILEKNIDALNGGVSFTGKQSKTRLMNVVMQLRKCCNHPYLFDGAEPGPPYSNDIHLVENSGKMAVLDPLLKRLKENGSRVLIFSQMSRVLDILEDYCFWRNYECCRIDGQTSHEDRISFLEEYNRPGSEKFIFLLTTRAGGLGINLTTADIVIMFDSDWNPQVDLQAEDRAHRIGQKKQVFVYRFITENAIEEKVIERATQKLCLDKLVIQQANIVQKTAAEKLDNDYLSMIRHGAQELLASNDSTSTTVDSINIDEILRRGEEKTSELSAKYENAKLDELFCNKQSAYEWDGEDYRKRQVGDNWGKLNHVWIGPAKRERKQLFPIQPPDLVKAKSVEPARVVKRFSRIKQPIFVDFQFYSSRLVELQWKKYYIMVKDDGLLPEIADEEEIKKIEEATPLTLEEDEELEQLNVNGFYDWTRREFTTFLRASERYGRLNVEKISEEIESKNINEVQKYAETFWQRYKELQDWEKKIADIVRGEQRTLKQQEIERNLMAMVGSCKCPLVDLKLPYTQKTRSKQYTEEEDIFLLTCLAKFGISSPLVYDKIQNEIRSSHLFQFNWYFLSRSANEISRRITTLLSMFYADGQLTQNNKVQEPEPPVEQLASI